jgi:hypothetical protein
VDERVENTLHWISQQCDRVKPWIVHAPPAGRWDATTQAAEGCLNRKTPATLQGRRGFDVNLPLGK